MINEVFYLLKKCDNRIEIMINMVKYDRKSKVTNVRKKSVII